MEISGAQSTLLNLWPLVSCHSVLTSAKSVWRVALSVVFVPVVQGLLLASQGHAVLPARLQLQIRQFSGKSNSDMTIKRLCMNLHFFCVLVSAMNIILGHYNLIILLELMV